MLQVLNELRIGSWIKLGRPENLDAVDPDDTSVAMAPLHWLMVLTGQFEMVLVHAMHGDSDAALPPPSRVRGSIVFVLRSTARTTVRCSRPLALAATAGMTCRALGML